MEMKNIVIFIVGFVAGIIVTLIMLFGVSVFNDVRKLHELNMRDIFKEQYEYNDTVVSRHTPDSDDGIEMFDEPKGTINVKSFVVYEVLPNGSAVARHKDLDENYGLQVLFIPKNGESFYDRQIIKVTKGKCVRRVGTYNDGFETLPVVEIQDR